VKAARGEPSGFIAVNALAVSALVGILVFLPDGVLLSPAGLTLVAVGVLGVGWVILLVVFFRDPERTVGEGIVSPADGRVRVARNGNDTATISVFLRIHDVHVIRSPIKGRVDRLEHKRGGHRFAFSKDAETNERLILTLEGGAGRATLTLIAGAFADRIEPYVGEGDRVEKGQRVGIIMFGSRADLTLAAPNPVTLRVKVGDTVKAGETTILEAVGEAATQ